MLPTIMRLPISLLCVCGAGAVDAAQSRISQNHIERSPGADIYLCFDEQGHRVYSDVGCSPHSRIRLPLVNRADGLALSQSERATLRTQRQRQARERQQSRKDAAARRAAITDARNKCAQSKTGLKDLARIRRHGYRPKDQSQLDDRERRLRAAKRTYC
ncbi:MAG: hypothetical protein AAF513_10605 [Pseudomonadota bacterium]